MLIKVALLLACGLAVWFFTRPRRPRPKKKRSEETPLVVCSRCGAYYPRGESCDCE